MVSDELRFKHVGLSSDGAVVFCEMENGKTYAMPLRALDRAKNWNPKAKPRTAAIIHDGYAVVVKFSAGVEIDFPSDFVLHVVSRPIAGTKLGAGHQLPPVAAVERPALQRARNEAR